MKILKKSIFFVLFLLAFQQISKAADGNVIPYTKHPWLNTLSTQEQRAALVIYQIALSEKVENVMAAAKSDHDRMWGVKILACGHLFAAQTATKNEDQREALAAITMALRDGIAGKGTSENRVKAIKKAEIMGQKIATSVPDKLADHMQEKYAAELSRFNTELIVGAMGCASENSPSRQKP